MVGCDSLKVVILVRIKSRSHHMLSQKTDTHWHLFRKIMQEIRTNSAQLPSYQELCDILAHEAPHQIPQEKKQTHYGDFATMRALLNSYGLSTKFFNQDIRFENLKEEALFEEVLILFSELTKNILRTRDNLAQQTLLNSLYDYLSKTDKLEQADIIFVFGSKAPFRIERRYSFTKKDMPRKYS